jgi:hypothetical protein
MGGGLQHVEVGCVASVLEELASFIFRGQSVQDMCQILTGIVVPDLERRGRLCLGQARIVALGGLEIIL